MQNNQKSEHMTAWELFELITSVHGGKQMYFKETEDFIYSRWTHRNMTFDEAIDEFISMIGE